MTGKVNSSFKNNPWGDDHPEKIRENASAGTGFKGEIKNQLQGIASPDAWFNQILGRPGSRESYPQPKYGEITSRKIETLVFCRAEKEAEENLNKETQQILQNLKEQITVLEKSEKNLVKEISKVKVEQLPKKKGIYYLRFLEWLLTIVKQLRVKVEEGRAWLSTFQNRKKKLGYWKMYKKHGTTFGLSHERTLATQTG